MSKEHQETNVNQSIGQLPQLSIQVSETMGDVLVRNTMLQSAGWSVDEAAHGISFLLEQLPVLRKRGMEGTK